MILKYSLAALALFAAIALALRWPASPEPAVPPATMARRALEALERGDHAAFIAQADRRLGKMRLEDFRTLAGQHAARLHRAHELRPLDERWRGDVLLTRWKLVFQDGSPDAVLTLGLKDGKVATFMLY